MQCVTFARRGSQPQGCGRGYQARRHSVTGVVPAAAHMLPRGSACARAPASPKPPPSAVRSKQLHALLRFALSRPAQRSHTPYEAPQRERPDDGAVTAPSARHRWARLLSYSHQCSPVVSFSTGVVSIGARLQRARPCFATCKNGASWPYSCSGTRLHAAQPTPRSIFNSECHIALSERGA